MVESFEDACHRQQGWLTMVATGSIPSNLQRKLSPEDLVQETYLRAVRFKNSFRADVESQALRTWLTNILKNVLIDTIREFQTDKRNIDLEASVHHAVDKSSCGVENWITADQTSPSLAAYRNERYAKLAAALNSLPLDQRQVLTLHHLQGQTLKEIADQLDLSGEQVAKLLRVGLQNLRLCEF